MSTIHSNWDAEADNRRRASAAVCREGHESSSRDSGAEHDQDLMFAWSIGTTELAREMPQNRRKEECTAPPEVYIG